MINKNDFSIKIIDSAPDIKYRVEHTQDGNMIVHEKSENERKDKTVMIGEIIINDYWIKFYMGLKVWSAADYVQQWDEGIHRLEKYDQSCLVTNVDIVRGIPLGEWWTLYRVDGQICMQYHILYGEACDNAIMNGLFTPETCYDFIPLRKTHEDDGEEIPEYIVGKYNGISIDREIALTNKGIRVDIIDEHYEKDVVLGRIMISDYYETFELAADCCWSVADYVLQWKQGLERLRSHEESCLVIAASSYDCGRFVNWWLLYKKNGKVYACNQILVEHIYEEVIGTRIFTAENCYEFIPAVSSVDSESEEISKLCVKYDDLFL